MPMGLPAGVVPGQIYRHDRFYKNENGEWQTKYLLVLTGSPDGDVVFRLLTSRAHCRRENPRCYHGDPYPGFFLGYLGRELTAKSWSTCADRTIMTALHLWTVGRQAG